MKFTIDRSVFLEGVQKTLGIVERRTTMPILNNILIRTIDSNKIVIVASDRDTSLTAYYEAAIEEAGEITVPAKKMHEILREIDGERISFFAHENNRVDVTCGKVAFRVPGIPVVEFPEVTGIMEEELFSVSSEVLHRMITKTSFAIANDDMRPVLSGVCFTKDGAAFDMVATDGHRLAMATAIDPVSGRENNFERIIIPRKGVNEIRKLIEAGVNSVSIGVHERAFFLKTDHSLLRVNLIDGEYPDYQKVLPQTSGVAVEIDRSTILHSLRRMSVISSDSFSGVKIQLTTNRVVLDSTNPDIGEAHDEIEISYTGNPLEVGYNVRYLIDAIEVLDGPAIAFEMRDGHGPGVIRPVGDDGYLCVIMPVKLRKD